ncbi:MAG TPA: uracil-DNA glycosylase [Deltaproteobacteria bacterium]|nr:uracil-DNA glycosylase [Deltaproteobacteria bacterium]
MASAPDSDPDPRREAHALVASARALLQELVEEGVTDSLTPPTTAGPSRDASGRVDTRPPTPRSAPPSRPDGGAAPAVSPTASAMDREAVPWADRRPTLEEVRSHLGECVRCDLARGRHSIVFGDGNPDADLMFVGEAPGEQEDLRGLPFVGRAGELLTQMIEKGIGIPRSQVYICNIVKCRPPRNRNPLPPEVSACRPFLDGQIRAVAPRVIVTLGKPAAGLLLGREVAITRLRGTWQEYQGIPLMPTLHPAYVLRQYTPENRRAVWQDLKAAWERSRA